MTTFNLPLVITGRLATNGKEQVIILNSDDAPRFYAGKDPKDFDKKLKDFAWEVVVGKSGENFKTRYFLAENNETEIDAKYVKTCGDERYSIKDAKKDAISKHPDVAKMMTARGKQHGSKWSAKFDRVMSQGISLLKDKSRPLTMDDRAKMQNFTDKLYAEYRRLLNEEPSAKSTDSREYGISL